MCSVVLSVKRRRITKYKRYTSPTFIPENEQSMGFIMSKGQGWVLGKGDGIGQDNYTAALRKKCCHHRINTYINIMSYLIACLFPNLHCTQGYLFLAENLSTRVNVWLTIQNSVGKSCSSVMAHHDYEIILQHVSLSTLQSLLAQIQIQAHEQ